MKIAIVGTGYVGLVTGTCLADKGNLVTCVDIDQRKIDLLNAGEIPIYEPGLAELVTRNREGGRLHFTCDLPAAVREAQLVFLAVGTPMKEHTGTDEDGSADLTSLWQVVDALAPHLAPHSIVVIKSTVPVGTNTQVYDRLRARLGRECDVASNPEFLKEGAAIEDFRKPDRVVIGVRRAEVAEVLRELYRPFLLTGRPLLTMSPESAEMTKYVANALLATKISFINEMANLCGKMSADINEVRLGIGHDSRIGFAFLFPGVGYGGSCFPKDIRALVAMGKAHHQPMDMMRAVDQINQRQKSILIEPIERALGSDLSGKVLAVWGLAFKPRTDDIREAPALRVMSELRQRGARVQAYDPEAIENVRRWHPEMGAEFCDNPYEALNGVDALVIMTEWEEFRQPDFDQMRKRMRGYRIFDGRNLYEPEQMLARGFEYHSIGRRSVTPG